MTVETTIVIVNYKVKPLVLRLLASIRQHVRIPHEVFVVDNASADGIGEALRQGFPDVRFIGNTDNRGFAAACDQGIRAAAGRHVLLLNPDTELLEDAPAALVRFADAHPDAAVVGCRILNPDRTLQRSVLGFPRLMDQALILLKLHHLLPGLPPLRRYFRPDFDHATAQRVDQVSGACFLMTRAGLDRLGPLDERYFIWFEEVDWCRMAKDARLAVWYVPDVSVIHHGGQSFGQVFAPRRQRMFDRSLAAYMRKHHGPLAAAVVRLLHPAAMLLAWTVGLVGLKRRRYA